MSDQSGEQVPMERKRKAPLRKYDDSKNRASSSVRGLPYRRKNIENNTQYAVDKFREHYREIAPEAQMVVDQIIDPERQMSVVRMPTYGVSAVYQAENVLQAQYDTDARSMVAVSPTLSDTIFATAGSQYPQTVFEQTTAGVNPYSMQSFSIPEGGSAWWTEPIRFHEDHVALPFPNAAKNAMLYPVGASVLATAGTGSNWIVFQSLRQNLGKERYNVAMQFYDSSLNLIPGGPYGGPCTYQGQVTFLCFNTIVFTTLPAYFSIEISTNSNGFSPFVDEIQLTWYESTSVVVPATMVIADKSQHCISYSVNNASTIIETGEQYLIAAQSCLLTYEGSDLYNNGALAIARIPGDSPVGSKSGDVSVTNWYQFIASLQRNKYEGATKHGGYAFYLGEDERSYFYRPTEGQGFGPYPYIAAEWTSDPTAPQVVRIKVSTIVQFTTNSNIYDQKPSCFLGQDYQMILYILSNVNAAYDNPGHRAKLTAALKKVGGKVIQLLKNPKTYTTLGSIVAALGAL